MDLKAHKVIREHTCACTTCTLVISFKLQSLSLSISIHFKFSSPNGAQLATCNSPVRATRPTGRRDCSLSPSLAPRARRLASQIAFPPQFVCPSLGCNDFKQVYIHLILSGGTTSRECYPEEWNGMVTCIVTTSVGLNSPSCFQTRSETGL